MKTIQVFLFLSCLLFFAAMGNSQMNTTAPVAQPRTGIAIDAPRGISKGCEAALVVYRANVDFRVTGTLLDSWRDPKFRAALGVSDEYYKEILTSASNASEHVSEHPEYRKAEQEHEAAQQALYKALGISPHAITPMISLQGADEATLKAFDRSQEASRKLQSVSMEYSVGASKRSDDAFHNALTPELKQKLWEVPLAEMAMGVVPNFGFMPNVFKALNLTDTQREQMERIKKVSLS